MTQRSIFVFCLIVLSAVSAYSQGKSVTNADLEIYKESRLKAEREYRDNYKRLGFPSPEELDRRREESRLETERLSAKLRSERLERERLEMQRQAITQQQQQQAAFYRYGLIEREPAFYSPYYFLNYGRRHRQPVRMPFQSGYFAGGHFWPGGLGTPPPQPIRKHPHH